MESLKTIGQYKCQTCGAIFSMKGEFVKHGKTHTVLFGEGQTAASKAFFVA